MVSKLEEGMVLRHGEWRLTRRGHYLWVGHLRLALTIEWNCAGWGAALIGVGGESFSLYSDGRVAPAGTILSSNWPPQLATAETAELDFGFLNVSIKRAGERLRLENEVSGVSFLLSSLSDEVLYESRMLRTDTPFTPLRALVGELIDEIPLRATAPVAETLSLELEPEPQVTTAPQDSPLPRELSTHFSEFDVVSSLRGRVTFTVPFEVRPRARAALEHLARHGQASTADLRAILNRRLVDGILTRLAEDLYQADMPLIGIEQGSNGKEYSFKYKELA